jgi:hypothetical protein
VRASTTDLFLAVSAAATALPAYTLGRWLWAAHAHPGFRQAATAYSSDFPFGLQGSANTWASAGSAAVALWAAGLVSGRVPDRPRRVLAYSLLIVAAALLIWNLWSMM